MASSSPSKSLPNGDSDDTDKVASIGASLFEASEAMATGSIGGGSGKVKKRPMKRKSSLSGSIGGYAAVTESPPKGVCPAASNSSGKRSDHPDSASNGSGSGSSKKKAGRVVSCPATEGLSAEQVLSKSVCLKFAHRYPELYLKLVGQLLVMSELVALLTPAVAMGIQWVTALCRKHSICMYVCVSY